jgi:hypothetical protein
MARIWIRIRKKNLTGPEHCFPGVLNLPIIVTLHVVQEKEYKKRAEEMLNEAWNNLNSEGRALFDFYRGA